MVQLQQTGKISNNVVAFYTRMEDGNSSHIKFGGWDQSAIAEGGSLVMVRTRDVNSFQLNAHQFYIGEELFLDKIRAIDIDPMLPYIYMPDLDYVKIQEKLQEIYYGQGIKCDYTMNYCRFSKPCSDVNAVVGYDLHVTFYDSQKTIKLNI